MKPSGQSNDPTVASVGAVIASATAASTPAIPTAPIASTTAAAALPSMPSLLDWLISLRITPKDAREYTVALTDLGFDDLQSLQEDATEVDLRQAGMKPGHIRRISRALSIHTHLRQHANIEAVHSPHGSPLRKFRPADSKARLGGTKEGCKTLEGINGGGSVVLRACSSCVLTCDDGHGSQRRLAIAPVSGNDVIAVRYVDSNNVDVGGENAVLPVHGAESLAVACTPCGDLPVAKFGERGAEGVEKRSVEESKSTSDGTSDIISKGTDFLSSSGESSGEDFVANLSRGRSRNAAAFASSGGFPDPDVSVKDSHTVSSSSRKLAKPHRVRLGVHAKVGGIPDGNRRGTSQSLPRMSLLTNLDASTAATALQRGRYEHPLQRAHTPSFDDDPFDSHAFERVTRSSAPIRRTRLRSSNSVTRSMSSVTARPGQLLKRTQSERTSSLCRGAGVRGVEDANQGEQSQISDPPELVFGVGDEDAVSRSRGLDANGGAGSGAADGRLPPALQCLRDVELSYDFSDSGTLQMHGFVLKPDGMKSVPTLTPTLRDRGNSAETNHGSSSRPSYDDGIRGLRPPTLQTCFGSTGRFPYSRDSNFGGGDGGGSLRDGYSGYSGCSGYGSSWSNVVVLPPLTKTSTTPTPRRTRETTILLEQIGRGGGGTVYKALHVPSMRLVAVKMVEVYDDEKRRQMIKELRALLSMSWVPLTLVGGRFGTHNGGRKPPTDEWSVGSSESSGTCGGWPDADDDGSPVPGHGEIEGEESIGGTDGGKTRTAATATVTPPTLLSTLSSRDGTRDGGSAGMVRSVFGDGETGFEIGRRATSTCGFAPWSRGSSGNGTRSCPGGVFLRTRADLLHRREDYGTSAGRKGDVGGNGNGIRRDFPVVTFHDAYTDAERGSVCMVMEYMDGETLEDFVRRREALSESALAVVGRSVLRGLAEMHANHQIHRDIKPSNILLDRHGRIKISDFGIVRELNRTGSLAQTFTGTLLYMSPERITETDYSYPSDVWSLGMVMVALALGRFPLNVSPRGGYFEMVQAITEDPVPALPRHVFSEELCDFVEQMLRRRASDRPSAADLLNHPFLKQNDGCHKLVGMMRVAPASHAEVQSLLTKLVEYRLGEAFDREVSPSLGKDSNSLGNSTPRPRRLPRLLKADVGFLAEQLQVTRAYLVEEYDIICKRAEEELWWGKDNVNSGNNKQQQQDPFPKTHGGFFGGESCRDGRDAVSRQLPTIHKSRAPPLRSKSSPLPSLDLVFPDRNLLCETPSTAGSAFSSSASLRQRRQESGTPIER